MKKIIIVLLLTLLLTGCVEIVENDEIVEEIPIEEPKPITKQVCDWMGFSSSSIIEEQALEGYVFTGRTETFWCKNALNFQLKEGE